MSLYDTNIATYYDPLKDQYYYQAQMMRKLEEAQIAMMGSPGLTSLQEGKVSLRWADAIPSTNKKLLLLK